LNVDTSGSRQWKHYAAQRTVMKISTVYLHEVYTSWNIKKTPVSVFYVTSLMGHTKWLVPNLYIDDV